MIKEYIHQPYPFFEIKWIHLILISLFIAFLMLILQPFGLSGYHGRLMPYIELGYGIITFIVLIIDLFVVPFFFKNLFDTRKWTVLKQIILEMCILFTIGVGNYLYTSLFLSFSNSFKAFLIFQFYTLVIGIIPILVSTILNQNSLLSENLKLANEMNNDLDSTQDLLTINDKIFIQAENNKDKLEVNLSNFIYIASTGNYIQVFYLLNNEVKNILMRNTLKQVEEQLKDCHSIIKCHRAFLVNKNKILRVKGNSQGLRLILQNTDEEIPVSRNYSKSLKEIINV